LLKYPSSGGRRDDGEQTRVNDELSVVRMFPGRCRGSDRGSFVTPAYRRARPMSGTARARLRLGRQPRTRAQDPQSEIEQAQAG
jgi:hypothetical protein